MVMRNASFNAGCESNADMYCVHVIPFDTPVGISMGSHRYTARVRSRVTISCTPAETYRCATSVPMLLCSRLLLTVQDSAVAIAMISKVVAAALEPCLVVLCSASCPNVSFAQYLQRGTTAAASNYC
eukprot:14626-Heterococcus_DN1.PRE.4